MRPISNRDWARDFDEPIALPDGRALRSLRDAGDYITKLPKAEHTAPEWQAAMEALILVATLGGPTMFARIGIMRALNLSSDIRKLYSNTVVVDFEVPVSRLLHKFEQIVSFIGERAITISPEYKKFDFSRLDFEVDRRVAPRAPVAKFILEAQTQILASSKRGISLRPR